MKPLNLYKNALKTVIYFTLLFNVAPANAVDWETIITTKDYGVLVDLDAYNVQEGLPYITAKTAYKALQTYHVNTVKFNYLEKHITTQFDCTLHTYKHLKTVFFNQNNHIVGRGGTQNKFYAVKPNSTLASLESLVCQVHKMVGGY